MSSDKQSPGTPFRTVAGCLCSGGALVAVGVLAATQVKSCVRTNGQAAGSYDLTFENPVPTGKCTVDVTASHIAGHNLATSATWDQTGQILTVTTAIDGGALTDADEFGVDVVRVDF